MPRAERRISGARSIGFFVASITVTLAPWDRDAPDRFTISTTGSALGYAM